MMKLMSWEKTEIIEDETRRKEFKKLKSNIFRCLSCNKKISPVNLIGLCTNCYRRERMKDDEEYKIKIMSSIRNWQKENRLHVNLYMREYNKIPEVKEKNRKKIKKYREKNKDVINEKRRKRYWEKKQNA